MKDILRGCLLAGVIVVFGLAIGWMAFDTIIRLLAKWMVKDVTKIEFY